MTWTILLLVMLLGSGGATARRVAKTRRRTMRAAVTEPMILTGGHRLSLVDVLWDLGVSDYALGIMAAQGLLPRKPDDLDDVRRTMNERLETYNGDYHALIDDMLDAIQEFYDEHCQAGHRRMLPQLELRARKTLPIPGQDEAQGGPKLLTAIDASAPPQHELAKRYDPRFEDARYDELGHLVDETHAERMRLRSQRALHDTGLVSSEVDIDSLVAVDAISLMKSLLAGKIGKRIASWMEMSELRALRRALNDALAGLYDDYCLRVERDPSFYATIYDTAERWRGEQMRIRRMGQTRPWKGRPHELCCDMLVDETRILARHLAMSARRNVDDTIRAIHDHARQGNRPMAGYLLYLNHHAFFPDHGQDVIDRLRHIEIAAHRVQMELGALHAKRVI